MTRLMKAFNKIRLALLALWLPFIATAQNSPEMADAMRANGKIYVVVAVIAIIFVVMAVYLITIDRKISKIEKKD